MAHAAYPASSAKRVGCATLSCLVARGASVGRRTTKDGLPQESQFIDCFTHTGYGNGLNFSVCFRF